MRIVVFLSRVKRPSSVIFGKADRCAGSRFERAASTLPACPIFEAIAKHDPRSTAVIHGASNRRFCYGSLLPDVAASADRLSDLAHGKCLQGERVAFVAENSYDYVVTLLSILAHNAVALPLAPTHPNSELQYILENSEASLLLSTRKFEEKAKDVLASASGHKAGLGILEKIQTGATPAGGVEMKEHALEKAGLMLYTSGTTNRPKGVVLSNANIVAQARTLIEAWKCSTSDHLLHILPLHHIHGVVNALLTPLIAGSAIEFAYPFNAFSTWRRLAAPFLPELSPTREPISFITAVPTIYNSLLASFPSLDDDMKQAAQKAISPKYLRLNISGSAALPTSTKAAWAELSKGNALLERYGMTEVGMALSCGLSFADRVDGSVGWPLPSVEVRLVDTDTGSVILAGEELDSSGKVREGEVQLRGPTIFDGYFRNPEANAVNFSKAEDGKGSWFKTGDVAVRQLVDGAGLGEEAWTKGPMYFMRGRKSVDIIKVAGEKVSALEVERELLSLPEVAEAVVVGVTSASLGQKVAAVVVLTPTGEIAGRDNKPWSAMDMRRALRDRLATHKIPQELKVVKTIPRNAMGKVNKKSLARELFT